MNDRLTDNPEDEIFCDKDGIAGEGKYEPENDAWLKPCPFCGNDHPLHKPDCALISFSKGEEITAGQWNTRPTEDALRSERNQARRHCLREVRLLAEENEINQKLRDRLTAAYDVIGDFLAIYTVDVPLSVGYITDVVEKAKAVIVPAGEE